MNPTAFQPVVLSLVQGGARQPADTTLAAETGRALVLSGLLTRGHRRSNLLHGPSVPYGPNPHTRVFLQSLHDSDQFQSVTSA